MLGRAGRQDGFLAVRQDGRLMCESGCLLWAGEGGGFPVGHAILVGWGCRQNAAEDGGGRVRGMRGGKHPPLGQRRLPADPSPGGSTATRGQRVGAGANVMADLHQFARFRTISGNFFYFFCGGRVMNGSFWLIPKWSLGTPLSAQFYCSMTYQPLLTG